jgi:hypothetical protein
VTALEEVRSDTELHVHLDGLDYIDHACMDLLMSWEKQHCSMGGTLVMDWEGLQGRFGRVRPVESAESPAKVAAA